MALGPVDGARIVGIGPLGGMGPVHQSEDCLQALNDSSIETEEPLWAGWFKVAYGGAFSSWDSLF